MHQLKQYYAWMAISIGVSIGLQIILPFPLGLVAAVALFVALPWMIMKKKPRGFTEQEFKFEMECKVCHKKTNARQCPRCGSKSFGLR